MQQNKSLNIGLQSVDAVRHIEGKTSEAPQPSQTGSGEGDAVESTTYNDFFQSCRTPTGLIWILACLVALCCVLYLILLGLELLSTSAKIIGACTRTGQLLQAETTIPVLTILGILATVLLQAFCRATPSIVVPLVGPETISGWILAGTVALCLLLGFYLLGVEFVGPSGTQTAGRLLGETNPIAAVAVGTMATIMLQSSSTTMSLILSLVNSKTIVARQAIYMAMGSTIGSSVTSTVVALGQVHGEFH